MNSDVTAAGFRDFMEWSGSTGRKSDTNAGLLLNAASDALERDTGRIITASGSNTSRKFTSNGRAYVTIPDLRVASSVALQGASLTADAGYWLKPSRQSIDIYVGVQLRAFGADSYLANPEWFDRNLDQTWYRYGPDTSLPNDLVVTGLWGWDHTPSQWLLGIYALAGYFYQHADALFSAARQTPEGNVFDLSQLPTEAMMLRSWAIGDMADIA